VPAEIRVIYQKRKASRLRSESSVTVL
jgi:hypothetical protein